MEHTKHLLIYHCKPIKKITQKTHHIPQSYKTPIKSNKRQINYPKKLIRK